MFTNWLTDTTGLTNARSSTNCSTTRLPETNNHISVACAKFADVSAGLSLISGHNLTNLSSNIMTTPPDIVLEVGPAPATVRFMAHGLVLGTHSGYLRSAIRLDERGAVVSSSSGGGGGGSNLGDTIVYLTNVTPDQFAPLLTYMYTGYLDLNVENIFGVLLATHVLHMPRALEICRSYLARAQTEGYFGPNNASLSATAHNNMPASNSSKIIRPIASKPQLANFGFLPITQQPLVLNPLTTNASIKATIPTTVAETETNSNNNSIEDDRNNKNEDDDDIEVDEVDKQSLNNQNQISLANEDDEDVEVFIDSNSEADIVVETQIQKLSFRKLMENEKSHNDKHHNKTKTHHKKSSAHHSKSERRKKSSSSSGLQVAKAPIPASQLECAEANKVIIDVASCDGPVRFKRILNTAYGHKPDASCSSANNQAGGLAATLMPERSLQSVSLSFHQQMAKTISQQQQQLHQSIEESENSETSNGSTGAATVRGASERNSSGNRKTQSEVFVCVYCKHTFKSQYCYQKHAKRHLNPLTLQATCVPEGTKTTVSKEEPSSLNSELQITKHQNANPTRPFYNRNSAHYLPTSSSAISTANITSSSEYLRREVRPLDMNVQYYPCKTCGCKFPSYYFVHKHRKMCHAEEEAQQQSNTENNTNNTTQTNAGPAAAAAAATTLAVASGNAEECLNSQNSD